VLCGPQTLAPDRVCTYRSRERERDVWRLVERRAVSLCGCALRATYALWCPACPLWMCGAPVTVGSMASGVGMGCPYAAGMECVCAHSAPACCAFATVGGPGSEKELTFGTETGVQARTRGVPRRAAAGQVAPGGAVAVPNVQEHPLGRDAGQEAEDSGSVLKSGCTSGGTFRCCSVG